MKNALAHFASDWSRRRRAEPGLFPEAQEDLFWWEAFSEFAQAEIFNESFTEEPRIRS
jgi:hypothetical protein